MLPLTHEVGGAAVGSFVPGCRNALGPGMNTSAHINDPSTHYTLRSRSTTGCFHHARSLIPTVHTCFRVTANPSETNPWLCVLQGRFQCCARVTPLLSKRVYPSRAGSLRQDHSCVLPNVSNLDFRWGTTVGHARTSTLFSLLV